MDKNTENRIQAIETAATLEEIQTQLETVELILAGQVQAVNQLITRLLAPNKITD